MTFTDVITGISGLTHYYPLDGNWQGKDAWGATSTDPAARGSNLKHADFIGSGVTFGADGATFPGSETNGYLTIPHHPDFSVRGTGTNQMTLIFFLTVTEWLNTTNGNEYLHWAGKGSPTANNLEWGTRHYVDNRNGTATGEAPVRQGRTSCYYWASDGGQGNGAYLNAGDPESTSEIMMVVRMNATSSDGSSGATTTNYIKVNNGTTVVNTQPINGGTNASLVIAGPYAGKVSLGKRLDDTGALIGKIRRFASFNRAITDSEISTLYSARAQADSAPTTLQIHELDMVATVNTTTSALQIMSASLDATGNAPTLTGTVQVGGANVTTVLPNATVTAAVTVNGSYTSTNWTVNSASLPVQLAGSDTVKSFVAPTLLDGGSVLLDVTATGPGGTSAPLQLTVQVLPQVDWHLRSDGVWRPVRQTVPL